jgi:cytochrome P450
LYVVLGFLLTIVGTMYFLATNPHVQEKAYKEIQQVLDQHHITEEQVDYEMAMSDFPYLKAIINETLRLCGPASTLLREVTAESITLELKSKKTITLSKGTTIACLHGMIVVFLFYLR